MLLSRRILMDFWLFHPAALTWPLALWTWCHRTPLRQGVFCLVMGMPCHLRTKTMKVLRRALTEP